MTLVNRDRRNVVVVATCQMLFGAALPMIGIANLVTLYYAWMEKEAVPAQGE